MIWRWWREKLCNDVQYEIIKYYATKQPPFFALARNACSRQEKDVERVGDHEKIHALRLISSELGKRKRNRRFVACVADGFVWQARKWAANLRERAILPPLENFSIDDGNGSDNVSFKMNSRFFNLCRVYSNLLKMASVGEFP